jgi:hypothetical protein
MDTLLKVRDDQRLEMATCVSSQQGPGGNRIPGRVIGAYASPVDDGMEADIADQDVVGQHVTVQPLRGAHDRRSWAVSSDPGESRARAAHLAFPSGSGAAAHPPRRGRQKMM